MTMFTPITLSFNFRSCGEEEEEDEEGGEEEGGASIHVRPFVFALYQ